MAHPVVHFEIGTKDGARSAAFYRELFGWEITPAGEDYWLVAGQETGIGGGLMQASGDIPAYVTVYVATQSVAQSLARANELGGTTLLPPMPLGETGQFAMFQDVDGNAIGLFEERTEPSSS